MSEEELNPPQEEEEEEYELPLKEACTYLYPKGNEITSMNFHPFHQTLLIAGCLKAAVYLWDVAVNDRRCLYQFELWKSSDRSPLYKEPEYKDDNLSVTQVTWSPDGKFFGVSFTKQLIHIYLLKHSERADQYVEFEAHAGRICDFAFCHRNEQVDIVTCGDDLTVLVWELKGEHEAPMMLFLFNQHDRPVKTLCVRKWEDSQVVFSTDADGKTKVFRIDDRKSIMEFGTGLQYSILRSSADGSRLFCSGLHKGDPVLMELDIDNKTIKRTYSDVGEQMHGFMQFDTTQNRFLAAGVGKQIKFWDMDHISVLKTIEDDKTKSFTEFLRLPRLRFNMNGNLLAVEIDNCQLRIFANAKGREYLKQVAANREPSKRINIK